MLELIQQEAGAVLGALAILGGLLGGIKLLELLAKRGERRTSH
jgi:hypothetical protein